MINYDFNYWKKLEPMKYYDKHREELSDKLKEKYDEMINNKNNKFIATIKNDGEWLMCIKWNNQILLRSRNLSKVSGEYGDKTNHLPHLINEMNEWPDNSVVLAEVCWGEYGTISTDVGTILRCLPDKAVERQKEKKLVGKVFDVLAWNNEVWMQKPYEFRILRAVNLFPEDNNHYFVSTDICPSHLTPAEFADYVIGLGGEGVVIQRKDYVYEPGKRSAWKTLKLKQRLPEMEFKVVSVLPAKKEYNGKYPESWPYWSVEKRIINSDCFIFEAEELIENPTEEQKECGQPVSKPYFYGWSMGVQFEYNGSLCEASSGLTDEDREWLSSNEAQELINNGELWVVVRAMQENKNTLRHPVVVRLRTDVIEDEVEKDNEN